MRKMSFLALLLALALLMSGCALITVDEKKDNAQPIINVDGEIIDKQTFTTYYNNYLAQYGDAYVQSVIESDSTLSMIYQIYGGDMSSVDQYYQMYFSEDGSSLYDYVYKVIKNNITNNAVQNLVILKQAAKQGMDQLTDEELAEVNADAETQYNTFLDNVAAAYMSDSTLEGDALREAAKALVEKKGYCVSDSMTMSSVSTLEEYQTMLKNQKIVDKLIKATITDEEVQAVLEENNYRMVKHILIMFGDGGSVIDAEAAVASAQADVETAQANLDNPAEEADLEALQTALDDAKAALETAQANLIAAEEIKAKAENVYALATAEGADFNALIDEYNEDTGMLSNPDGYALGTDNQSTYVQAFSDAAMALENVGDISQIVETTYGYHIIRYDADASSTCDAMNSVRDNIRYDKLAAPYEEWYKAMNVSINLDRLN